MTTDNPIALTDIVCDEARAFDARHPGLDDATRALGMLTYGLLRAVLACDCAPGVYRVPQDTGWHTLVCPQCRGVWTYCETLAPPPRAKRTRRTKEHTP